jgi:NADPH:quinone reductase-like Zn-dependent oxidoreductase
LILELACEEKQLAGFEEKLRLREMAAEDIYFAKRDKELIRAIHQKRSELSIKKTNLEIPSTFRKIHVVNMSSMNFADQTQIVDVPIEPPGRGEVLVKLEFSGVEASDILQNMGAYGPLSDASPEVELNGKIQLGDCGLEGVGVVVATGEGVELQVGKSVLIMGFGTSYREYVTCPAAQVIPLEMPATAFMTAIPISAATAACALDIHGQLKKGEQVLVTGAAGGTGQFAVQWAKVKYNARVVGICGSSEKEQMLHEIGCDETINYRRETDIAAAIKARFPDGIDVAYEGVCGPLRDAVWANMATFGRMIRIGSVGDGYDREGGFSSHPIDSNSAILKSLTCTGFYLPNLVADPRLYDVINEVIDYVENGDISIRLDPYCQKFKGLEGVYEAQKYIRTGRNVGKVYVSI